MAVEIIEILSEKLRLLSSNPNLKSEAEKSFNELQELQKSLKSAVSVPGSDKITTDDWLKLLKDIYFVEDMIDAYLGTMIPQSHKGFNMMYNSESFKCWLNEKRLRKKIGKLKGKVIEHMKVRPTDLSSNSETGVGQGQPTGSKAVGVRPKANLEVKQATIGEDKQATIGEEKQATIGEDMQASIECSLGDFIDMEVPQRKPSNDSDDKPVTIILGDLVKKLAQPVLSRCMLQYLISKALVAFSSKAILLCAVYHSEDIKQYFPCIAWVNVHEGSKERDILEAILEQVMHDEEKERHADKFPPQQMLHDFLVQRRYLIVLYGALTDSVWNNLESAFPFCFNGSRVILAVQNSFGRDHPRDSRKKLQQLLEANGGVDNTAFRDASEEWPQPFAYLEDDSSTIGIKAAMSKLTQSILSPDRLLFLISIVGVERFGNSTLLWKIYDAKEVKRHFECRAWVHVQEDFKEIDVLIEIWKQIGVREITLSLEPMRQMVCNFLAQKRYLIVLCDVWTSSVWESLKISLPNSLTGSRVILGVHDADIARQTNSWLFQMTPKKELLPNLKHVHEDALDQKVAQRWNSVSDIMENTSEIIGTRDKIEELAKLALNSYRLHFLISVVGEAGSGKTTLVKAFYDSIASKQHFDCRAWITVSQEYDERDLLVDISGQLMKTKQKQSLSMEQLEKRLYHFLKWRRYLIVLDDLQTPQIRKKNKLIDVLPNSSNGSRVILTIREAYLAYHMNPPAVVLPLRPLNKDESRRLFLKKVQTSVGDLPLSLLILAGLLSNQQASSETKNIEGDVVRLRTSDTENPLIQSFKELPFPSNYCFLYLGLLYLFLKKVVVPSDLMQRSRGLPLSIILLAGLLPNQRASSETENISPLIQSYRNLPFPLNHCLLYLGLFPVSFDIPIRRLILIWLAEGLIIQPEGNIETPEELAMQQFVQLQRRNLVEIGNLRLDGSPKTCRLPTALHNDLSENAEKFGFFHIHPNSSSSTASNSDTTQYGIPIRRLAERSDMFIYTKHEKYCMRYLRTYISFYNKKGDRPADGIKDVLKKIVKDRFGKLVVLDLEGVYKPAVSEALERLPYLKYLGLRRTHLDSVPKSVAELPHLQSLDVKHTNVITLPSTIWEAKKLQHLYMSEIYVDLSIQKAYNQEGSPANLHTLWGLKIRDQIPNRNQLDKLVDVRKLKLTCYDSSMEVIDVWLAKLTNLQSLKLRSVTEHHGPSELPLKCMTKLQRLSKLYLLGKLTRPKEILGELPRSLTVLTLSGSYLFEDPMEMLAELKELKVLRLYGHSFKAETMVCRNLFPKLQALKLWKLEELQHWIVEDGAMPVLENLEIRYCNQLKEVNGLEKITTLTELTLTGMASFVDEVKGIMGGDVKMEEKPPEVVSFKRIKNSGENEISK